MSHGVVPLERDPQAAFKTKTCIQDWDFVSSSPFFDRIMDYYISSGTEAWTQHEVPSFITSNAKIAADYASVCAGYIRDMYKKNPDRKEPVPILELGAGHGRFTYYFLEALSKYYDKLIDFGLPSKPFLVVFTDFCKTNLEAAKVHPKLQKYFELEWLELAHFDCLNYSNEVELLISKKKITISSATILIANYVFCTLRQEYFYIEKMSSEEENQFHSTPGFSTESLSLECGKRKPKFFVSQISVFSEKEDPHYLDLFLGQRFCPFELENFPDLVIEPQPRPEYLHLQEGELSIIERDIEVDYRLTFLGEDEESRKRATELLLVYASELELEARATIALPTTGLKIVRDFHKFTNGQTLVLVGDKGYFSQNGFLGKQDIHAGCDGTLSFMLNFDSIEKLCQLQGGKSLSPDIQDGLQCRIFLPKRDLVNTELMFSFSGWDFGPDVTFHFDVHLATTFSRIKETTKSPLTLPLVNAMLRFCRLDPLVLGNFVPIYQLDINQETNIRTRLDIKYLLDHIVQNEPNSFKSQIPKIADIFYSSGFTQEALDLCERFYALDLKANSSGERKILNYNLSTLMRLNCQMGNSERALFFEEKLRSVGIVLKISTPQISCCVITTDKSASPDSWLLQELIPSLVNTESLKLEYVYVLQKKELKDLGKVIPLKIAEAAKLKLIKKPIVPKSIYLEYSFHGLENILKNTQIEIAVLDVPSEIAQSLIPRLMESGKNIVTRSRPGRSGEQIAELWLNHRQSKLKSGTPISWVHVNEFWNKPTLEKVREIIGNVDEIRVRCGGIKSDWVNKAAMIIERMTAINSATSIKISCEVKDELRVQGYLLGDRKTAISVLIDVNSKSEIQFLGERNCVVRPGKNATLIEVDDERIELEHNLEATETYTKMRELVENWRQTDRRCPKAALVVSSIAKTISASNSAETLLNL